MNTSQGKGGREPRAQAGNTLVLCMVLGTAIGAALDDIALGLGFGTVAGIVFGALVAQSNGD